MRSIRPLVLAAAIAAVPLGVATAQPPPYPPIPAPQYEAVPPPPGTQYVWQPGQWHWNGVRYVWLPGHYVVRRVGWHRFVPGAWVPRGGGWVWVPGHWA